MNKVEHEKECRSCRGTGLYSGFAEPQGTAVVCLTCGGIGKEEISYKPFKGRKTRRDIEIVKLSAGNLIVTGVGPRGNSITYQEFLDGKMPNNI